MNGNPIKGLSKDKEKMTEKIRIAWARVANAEIIQISFLNSSICSGGTRAKLCGLNQTWLVSYEIKCG